MFDDLRRLPGETSIDCDVCIVGAGPAGITIAKELLGSGLAICVVESGGLAEEPVTDALNEGFSVGHPARMEGRFRAFGGSSIRWAGRCATLDPIDFAKRDWVNVSGWPVSFEQMQSYYDRAKVISNFDGRWTSDGNAVSSVARGMPPFKFGKIEPFVWRTASPAQNQVSGRSFHLGGRQAFDFGQAYRTVLEQDPHVRVILHATVVGLHPTRRGDSVESVRISSLNGNTGTVTAKSFVLCGSGIENARLLLNAPESLLENINKYDTVGRFLTQHPRGFIGSVEADIPTARRLQRLFNHFFRPNRIPIQYEVGLALTDRAQREHRLLNASAVLRYQADEDTARNAAKRLRAALAERKRYDGLPADIARLALGLPSEIPNSVRRFLGYRLSHKRPFIEVEIDLEQEPIKESRLTLSDVRDALGVRRVQADWRISEAERRTAAFFGQFLRDEFESLGLGRFEPAKWLSNDVPLTDEHLAGNYHFIGTTRMSDDPREGVVDADCRAHGAHNLYLAGCSVFSTGGHANPTLTIVALAIRLADHLRKRHAG